MSRCCHCTSPSALIVVLFRHRGNGSYTMSQSEYKKRLKALMSKPENQVCSDCPERQPRWASLIVPPPGAPPGSLPIGAFCCLECSGSHRRLGVHISFVRSINLDSCEYSTNVSIMKNRMLLSVCIYSQQHALVYCKGKEKEVLAMENGGNKKVNAIFEARLAQAGARKPTTAADGPTRERFIRDKYERRKYYDASVFETYETDDEEDEAPAPSSRRTKVSRHPSEAARLRAESRRAKTGALEAAPKTARAAAAPALAAAEVDLLDFAAFDSPAPAPVAPAPAAPTSSNLDLFANMTLNGSPPKAAAPTSPAQPMRKSNDDILAMFSTPSTSSQSNVMDSAVAMNTANGSVMMAGVMPQQNAAANPIMMANNNMFMMQGGQQPNMAMMQPNMMQGQQQPNMFMLQGSGFGNNMQQQNGTMFMQQQGHAMLMQQQGNNTLMLQKNNAGNVMMMQHGQQQPSFSAMQLMQQASNSDDFGFPQAPMGSGPPIAQNGGQFYDAYSQQQQHAPQQPQNTAPSDDPFAQFGQNVFR